MQAYHLSIRARDILNGPCCCNRCPHVLNGGQPAAWRQNGKSIILVSLLIVLGEDLAEAENH